MPGPIDPETLYTKQTCIGGGSFGKVYKGVDRRSGESVAIKIIDVENAEDEVDDIIKEIAILSELKSPYVTKYHGSYLKGSNLWIIMEFCSGGSCHALLRPGVMSEDYIAIILRELLRGLDYLHGDQKLHRDIKAANILLSASGQVKLADFGVSGQLSATMTKKNTFVGTPFWMAPEVIKQSGYDYKADIWSLGITAIELACGDPPYADIHPMKVLFLIPKNPPPSLRGDFSKPFKQFVELCLRRDPKERPSAKELLEHPFIKRAKRTTYLTELIERAERWQATHRGQSDDGEDDDFEYYEEQFEEKPEEHEDLWDFGTVRPAGRVPGPAPVLQPLNESTTNSRSQEDTEDWDLHEDSSTVTQSSSSNLRQSNTANPASALSPSKAPLPPSSAAATPTKKPAAAIASPFGNPHPSPHPNVHFINTADPHKGSNERYSQGIKDHTSGVAAGFQPQSSLPNEYRAGRSEQSASGIASENSQTPATPVNRKLPPNQRPLPELNMSPRPLPSPGAQKPADASPRTPNTKPTSGLRSKLGPKPEDRTGGQHMPTHNLPIYDQARQPQIPRPNTQNTAQSRRQDACGDVIIPSLLHAVKKRHRSLAHLEPGRNPADPPPGVEEIRRWQRAVQVQRHMEELTDELARSFTVLSRLDLEDPVPITKGVDSVLEAFLEEVLVRVGQKAPSSS